MFTAKFGSFPQYKPVLDKLAKYQQTHFLPGGKGTLENHYTNFGQSEGDFFVDVYELALMVVNGVDPESKAFRECAAKVDFTLQPANNMSEGYIGLKLPKATTTRGGRGRSDDSDGGDNSKQTVVAFDSAKALVRALIDKTLTQPIQDAETVKKNRASRIYNLMYKKLYVCVLVNFECLVAVHSSRLQTLFHPGVEDDSLVVRDTLRALLQIGELHRNQVLRYWTFPLSCFIKSLLCSLSIFSNYHKL